MPERKKIENRVLEEIAEAIQEINYGEVVITIHNSRIVQIERKEKRRFH
ncbi:MAG: YezD family protein [Candidatus Omnitrophota bacterium]